MADKATIVLSVTAGVLLLILTVEDMFLTDKTRAEDLNISCRHKDCPVKKLLKRQRAKKVRKNRKKTLVEVESVCTDMEPWQLVV